VLPRQRHGLLARHPIHESGSPQLQSPHRSSAASVAKFGGLAIVPGSWWPVFVCGFLRRLYRRMYRAVFAAHRVQVFNPARATFLQLGLEHLLNTMPSHVSPSRIWSITLPSLRCSRQSGNIRPTICSRWSSVITSPRVVAMCREKKSIVVPQ
jgi:hypothetical protein